MTDFCKLERPLSTLKLGVKSAMKLKLWSRRPPSPPVTSSNPSIPPDLVFEILQHLLWHSPLSPKARRDILKSISLVDRTWHTIALRVSIRHIHLPGPLSTYALLPSRTLLPTSDNRPLIYTCTSITFTSPPSRLLVVILPSGTIQSTDAIPPTASSVLSFIDSLSNLHHLSLRYPHQLPAYIPRVRDDLSKIRFPPQLTHLSIDFSSTRLHYENAPALVHRPTVPTVRHLSLSGLPMPYIADILRIFTHVDVLIIALTSHYKGVQTDTGRLLPMPSLPSIPASVRTLVIRHPPSHKCRFGNGWVYSQFVAELASGGSRALRLVFRTSVALDDHDPQSFEGFQSYCERYGVIVEYEYDDQPFPR